MPSNEPTIFAAEESRPAGNPERGAAIELTQPPASKPMNPQRPHDDAESVHLRGGRSEMCPGRFCFIVPCPLPCDFCVI
ncbi:hypothetical protein SPI_07728 [Niveomyces insectorum RCEF 264]|uniref:Uncharacterized protein n=1 Tax=Niveomyces insectorum RCEF 264 TaxID=1081102 RepID=A0A167PJJ8_9HYPO|nr:hypothetical protein SPI_07728 [Niveomyces insectorum RCEF 264]